MVASAIGEPLHLEKSRLDPINIGETKVKVEILINGVFPSVVIIKETLGNSSIVSICYPRTPPKCLNCGRYGYLLNCFPKPLMKKSSVKKDIPSGPTQVTHPTVVLNGAQGQPSMEHQPSGTAVNISHQRRHAWKSRKQSKSRSKSSPPTIVKVSVVAKEEKEIKGSSQASKNSSLVGSGGGFSSEVDTLYSSESTIPRTIIKEVVPSKSLLLASKIVVPITGGSFPA